MPLLNLVAYRDLALNNAVSMEHPWAATSCNPLSVRRAGALPWLGTLNKSLSPLQKRTQGAAPDLVRAGVGPYGAWCHLWCPKPRKDPYGSDGCPNDPQGRAASLW
jgi:hypothetical protein